MQNSIVFGVVVLFVLANGCKKEQSCRACIKQACNYYITNESTFCAQSGPQVGLLFKISTLAKCRLVSGTTTERTKPAEQAHSSPRADDKSWEWGASFQSIDELATTSPDAITTPGAETIGSESTPTLLPVTSASFQSIPSTTSPEALHSKPTGPVATSLGSESIPTPLPTSGATNKPERDNSIGDLKNESRSTPGKQRRANKVVSGARSELIKSLCSFLNEMNEYKRVYRHKSRNFVTLIESRSNKCIKMFV